MREDLEGLIVEICFLLHTLIGVSSLMALLFTIKLLWGGFA